MQTGATTEASAAQGGAPAARPAQADGIAFERIMRHNNQRLFRLARSILKNDAEAEEVVQETYMRAFTQADGLAGIVNLPSWLARVAANESLDRLRRRRPATGLEAIEESMTGDMARQTAGLSGAQADDPEAAAARGEIRDLLEAAIDELPQGFRTVFVLRAIEEFSIEETASCLGIPGETVKTRFHRAKRSLRQALNQQLESSLREAFPFAGARCDRIVDRVMARLTRDKQSAE